MCSLLHSLAIELFLVGPKWFFVYSVVRIPPVASECLHHLSTESVKWVLAMAQQKICLMKSQQESEVGQSIQKWC